MKNINDLHIPYAKTVFTDFETKYFGLYHDFYIQSDTLLLADVFGNFRNMRLKIYGLDPAKYQGKIRLMVQEVIRGGICYSVLSIYHK